MELLYKDPELNRWCKSYSAYQKNESHNESHTEIEKLIYGSFTEEAYSFLPAILNQRDYAAYRFEKAVVGTKFDVAFGICLEIRSDRAGSGSLIYSAVADGRLYRLMAAYLGIESDTAK